MARLPHAFRTSILRSPLPAHAHNSFSRMNTLMKVIQIVPYIFLKGTPLEFYFIIVENIPKHDFRKASKIFTVELVRCLRD